jgi:hypothetical protein
MNHKNPIESTIQINLNRKKLTFMVQIKNQTEPIENRCDLVRFSDFVLKTDENQTNRYILLS